MKIILAALFFIGYCIFNACNDSGKSWKEVNNTDYIKEKLIYDCDDFYIYRDSGLYLLTFERGEYYAPYFSGKIPGIIKTSDTKAWIDSSLYDLERIKEYFSEFTNRRIK